MTFLYELAVLGAPSDTQVENLEHAISEAVKPFSLRLGIDINWLVRPAAFTPDKRKSAAAVFFGGNNPPAANIAELLRRPVPILPVVSGLANVRDEIPSPLQPLNCVAYKADGAERVATALLECVGLLSKQRRVFLSYRRNEAEQAAVQLFDAFSSRLFDVFLDTRGIPPAEDFQATLWHRLCDSDVLVMLDSPNYFESRWTATEFGRALAKGISILRIAWPDIKASARTATCSAMQLRHDEVEANGRLTAPAIERICLRLEKVRSLSQAVRNLNLVSRLRDGIEQVGGTVSGVGPNRAVYLTLPDGRKVVVYPAVGVPTSTSLHDAVTNSPDQQSAVIYDPVGLHPSWLMHLDWLAQYISDARWIKSSEAAWELAGWVQ